MKKIFKQQIEYMKKCFCCGVPMIKGSNLETLESTCPSCGHIFTPSPDNFDTLDYYCNEYRSKKGKDGKPVNAFFEEPVREKYEKNMILRLRESVQDFKPASILEIGPGVGYFLQRVVDEFGLPQNSATTCELNKDHSYDLSAKGFNSVFGDFTLVNFEQRFDLFLAIDVVEHIEDVSILPKLIKDLLNPEGVALIQVPINRTVKPFQEHFHYFNRESFSKLFEGSFKIINIFENGMRVTSNGPSMLAVLKNEK